MSSADALSVSAPELSVQLARRALLVGATDASTSAGSGEARNLVMRAQALLASGLVRISQHAKAVEPGFAALALAEAGGAPDVAAAVRIDLAACAQQVGEPLLGAALLRPVLEAGQTPPAVRASALGRLVGCVAHVARRDDVEDALTEADRLLAADSGIAADVRRMERARLAVRTAGYHRWYGDTEDAITAAREGLALLTRLRPDLRSESDRLRARLVLELVCGLLDEGELNEALNAAHPMVDEPVRATSAASVGRLMLAVATRVYLPSGQTDRGRHLLDQAAWVAERHTLDGLRADALTEVSRLEEQAGRATDALEAMRAARAAEHRRMRAVSRAARIVLVEVGANHGVRDTAQQSVAALMRQLAHPAGLPAAVSPAPQVERAQQKPAAETRVPATAPEIAGTVDMAKDNGLLDREGLIRRLHSVRTGERPVALTLVRFDSTEDDDRGPDTGIMAGLADKVRDMAPDNAELARSDGSELAVLLPATTRDQAEEFAATIRGSDWATAGGKDMNISTGVVQTDHAATDDKLDPTGFLTAARDALTPAQPSALSDDTPTRPLNHTQPTTTQDQARPAEQSGRSILSSLSIPSGSGGRRRAGEEQPPGAKSRWPAEPAEAPRWTRAERRAQAEAGLPTDPAQAPPPAGWPPATDEPRQGKRAATPTKPSFSESRIGEAATTGIDRTRLHARHSTPQDGPAAAEPGPTPGSTPAEAPHATPPTDQTRDAASRGDTSQSALPTRTPQAAPSAAGGGASAGHDTSDRAGQSEPAPASADSPSVTGTDDGFFSSLAGLSTGGMLRGTDTSTVTDTDDKPRGRSSYEETKAELARMMSALNAKSQAARERNGARQSIPTPPRTDDILDAPDPVPPEPAAAPTPPEPEVGGRSRLMAAFDALTGPVPNLRAEVAGATELPARTPAESWARIESSAVVESPADELFGTEPADTDAPRSSLGAAFADFGGTEKKVTEPVKETVQEPSYDAPIGPEPRPDDLPQRGERSSATIASLLTEALAAYQSTAEDAEVHRAPERFDSFVAGDDDRQQSGASGRHRSLD
ncbi:hypothetical protein [Actinophytocola sp. NPDC049390]|uniref:hypothetical protein n=1 Tax=Actinophytocola sp. NPDC049390 TaxID=3363894 RepID=UPI0037948FAD